MHLDTKIILWNKIDPFQGQQVNDFIHSQGLRFIKSISNQSLEILGRFNGGETARRFAEKRRGWRSGDLTIQGFGLETDWTSFFTQKDPTNDSHPNIHPLHLQAPVVSQQQLRRGLMTHCPRLCHVLSGCTKVSWRQAGFESNLRQQWYVQKCCLIFWTHTLPVLRKISGEMFGSFVGGSHQVHDGRLEVKLPEFSIMKLTSSCGNEDAFAQSSTNLTLVASFFPCLFWAHKYLYTSSFGNEIPPTTKGYGTSQASAKDDHPKATREFIRDSHQEFFETPTFMNHSWIIHPVSIYLQSRFCHPAQGPESLHFVETPILGAKRLK